MQELTNGNGYWTTPKGVFLLQLAQDTIAESLGVPLRIFWRDAVERVAKNLARRGGKQLDTENALTAFSREVLSLFSLEEESATCQEKCEKLANRLFQHQKILSSWDINLQEPKVEKLPQTDIKRLWEVDSSEWFWRTAHSNTNLYHRILISGFPTLRLVCRLFHLKTLDGYLSTHQIDNSPFRSTCLHSMSEYLIHAPFGVLLVGPVWLREANEPHDDLKSRIVQALHCLRQLDHQLDDESGAIWTRAFMSATFTSDAMVRMASIVGKCLESLDELVSDGQARICLESLHASEWVRLVQFALFFHQEHKVVEALVEKKSMPFRFFRSLRRDYPQGRVVGIEGDGSRQSIRLRIFSDQAEADKKEHRNAEDEDFSPLADMIRDYYQQAGQNHLLSEMQRISYFHRPCNQIVLHDQDKENDILLHRLKSLVNADFSAFYTYDATKDKLELSNCCVYPLSGTKSLRDVTKQAELKRILQELPDLPQGEKLYNAIRKKWYGSFPIVSKNDGSISFIQSWIAVLAKHMGRVFGIYFIGGVLPGQFRFRAEGFLARAAIIASPYLFRARLYSGLEGMFNSAFQAFDSAQQQHHKHPNYENLCRELATLFSVAGVSLWLRMEAEKSGWGIEAYQFAGGYGCFQQGQPDNLPNSWIEENLRKGEIYLSGPPIGSQQENEFRRLAGGNLEQHIAVPIPNPKNNEERLACLVLHEHCADCTSSPAQKLLQFVAQQLGVILQAVWVSRLEQHRVFQWIMGHDLRQSLIGIDNVIETILNRGQGMLSILDACEKLRQALKHSPAGIVPSHPATDLQRQLEKLTTDHSLPQLARNLTSGMGDLLDLAEGTRRFLESFDPVMKTPTDTSSLNPVTAYIESWKKRPLEDKINLYESIHAVLHSEGFRKSGKDFHVDPGLNDLPLVYLYQTQFQQVFRNLADNALKYSPKGYQISVTGRETIVDIEIDIINAGTLIEVDEREAIFQRGVRGKNVQNILINQPGWKLFPPTQSSGQGLYIARGIARDWGGDVKLVKSRKSSGSNQEHTFRITIPIYHAQINEYSGTA